MSSVQQPNGEDPPEAAGKHLDDAQLLFIHDHWDGAAYLAGYVVECSLKAVILAGGGSRGTWGGGRGHDLTALQLLAATVFSGRSAKYMQAIGVAQTIVGATGWNVSQRYFASGHIGEAVAEAFLNDAEAMYQATVIEMKKDGLV